MLQNTAQSHEIINLVRAAQNGNAEAFDELARRYERMVFREALARLGNYHDAEDETQNVLAEAFASIGRLNEPARIAAWLRRMTFHRCVDRLRRKLSLPECALEDSAPYRVKAELEHPHICLNRLSPALRETVEMHYLQNCSVKEISGRLGVPISTVKRRLHDARIKLRRQVTEKKFHNEPNL